MERRLKDTKERFYNCNSLKQIMIGKNAVISDGQPLLIYTTFCMIIVCIQ